MADHKTLYIYSAAEAKEHGEIELWRESHKENCECARAIEDAISRSFDGRTLQGDCAAEIIAQFGFNRVNFVLSNTMREKTHDGRFSPSNREWSRGIYVPQNDSNWAFTVESHPAVLDELISVKSLDDNETYWFSKRGLPWGTRENGSFLSHRNYAPTDGIQITGEAAEKIIRQWEH